MNNNLDNLLYALNMASIYMSTDLHFGPFVFSPWDMLVGAIYIILIALVIRKGTNN